MGLCCSAPRQGVDTSSREPPSTSPAGLVDRVLYPVTTAPGGVQLAVSQARFQVSAGGDTTPLLVRQTPQGVLVALFEGLGEDRHAVAAFCRSRVLELFQECAVRLPDRPLEALAQTLERLDDAIFATDKLKHATKVSSGASAVLVLVDPASQRCYCANVGAAQCLLSRISGSFNAKTPEGFFLASEHTTRNKEEMVRLQRRAPGETPPGTAGEQAAAEGPAQPTRALGFMEAKRQAGGSGALICEASATDHNLTGTDQHLVLASSAFFQLVGPADCALRAHFHEKFACRELERASVMATAAAAAGVQAAPSPALLQAANTAEHLVYWGLEKAALRAARAARQQGTGSGAWGSTGPLPPSVADVLALPLVRPPQPAATPRTDAACSSVAAAVDAEGAGGEAEQPAWPAARSDVVGDVGVLVITLRRQNQSMDGGMREMLLAARANAAAAAAAKQQQAGQAGAGYVERLGQRRWRQLKMLVDFHKAHRRVLLRQWWEAQDALFRRARISGSAAGRINLHASGRLSPSKLPALAAAAAAKRRAQAASEQEEDRGIPASKKPLAASANASPSGKPALAAGPRPASGKLGAGKPAAGAGKPAAGAGKVAVVANSSSVRAVRPSPSRK